MGHLMDRIIHLPQGWILTLALISACVLDVLFGDPAWIPHPVVLMGRCVLWFEKRLRSLFPDSPRGELAGGAVLAAVLPAGAFLLTLGLCRLCDRIHPLLYYAAEAFLCAQCLAARGLAVEAEGVRKALERWQKGQDPGAGIEEARRQVSRIVGRDTDRLDEAGVIRACVETVAENSSDGVSAPFLYMLIGGAPLALAYKAVNTMDSMVGYRNEKYLYFGRAAARLDDIANFLPSRITALLWILAAFLDPEADGRHAWKVFCADRGRHASPNAGQTESACAGALHIHLAGPASYFGVPVEKPWIGENDRAPEPEDIRRSVRLMWIACALLYAGGICVRACLI